MHNTPAALAFTYRKPYKTIGGDLNNSGGIVAPGSVSVSSGLGANTVVPEPASPTLILLVGLAGLVRRGGRPTGC